MLAMVGASRGWLMESEGGDDIDVVRVRAGYKGIQRVRASDPAPLAKYA